MQFINATGCAVVIHLSFDSASAATDGFLYTDALAELPAFWPVGINKRYFYFQMIREVSPTPDPLECLACRIQDVGMKLYWYYHYNFIPTSRMLHARHSNVLTIPTDI